MRKSQKLLVTSLLLAVIAVLTVSPTLSWLSSTSAPVINTFAGGVISVKLDEALVGTDGKEITGEGAQRVNSNNYKYTAGAVLDKDPTPTVLKGSEECYVFLLVDNGLDDKFTINYDTASWLKVAQSEGKAVYAYSSRVNASESTEDIVLKPGYLVARRKKALCNGVCSSGGFNCVKYCDRPGCPAAASRKHSGISEHWLRKFNLRGGIRHD